MNWEIVTLGVHTGFPERTNSRYTVVTKKPKHEVGEKIRLGDYDVEFILIRKGGKK
jgi:hypothetical protein